MRQADVGDTVTLETAVGHTDFRLSGLARAGAGDIPAADAAAGGRATAWFADAEAATGRAPRQGRRHRRTGRGRHRHRRPRHRGREVPRRLRRAGAHRRRPRRSRGAGLAYARETLTALGGFGGIATLVAVFTAAGTVALSVGQRMREFALLRRRRHPRQIRRAVAAEALLVAPVAGLIGCLPGIALASWWFGQLKDRGAVPEAVDLHVSWIPPLIAVGTGLPHGARRRLDGRTQAREDQAGAGAGRSLGGAAAARHRPYRPRSGRPRRRYGPRRRRRLRRRCRRRQRLPRRRQLPPCSPSACSARWCSAVRGALGLVLRGGGASSVAGRRQFSDQRTPVGLRDHPHRAGDGLRPTLVFMHTSESHVAVDNSSCQTASRRTMCDQPGGPASGGADRAASAVPGVDAAVSLLDTQVLQPVDLAARRRCRGGPGHLGLRRLAAEVQDLTYSCGR
ncbi:hypothetical protein LV779_12295 [Streptomyces thinghirensis]|nr:hypothetical protein [Streptomyces thinghirensis]